MTSDLKRELRMISTQTRIAQALALLSKRYRSGWLRLGVPLAMAETIFTHSEKVMYAALLYPLPRSLDRRRFVLMAYFHDIAEHAVPDYTPHDPITALEKHQLERAAIQNLAINDDSTAALVLDLWEEYEAQKTEEARLVYQLDKLDAVIQALEYGKLGYDVSEFFSYTEPKLTDPLLVRIFQDLRTRNPPPKNSYAQYFKRLAAGR